MGFITNEGGNMGTRSLTILPGEPEEVAVMYRQFDGYPTGHGDELQKFLAGKRVVNGFGADDTAETAFNGASCMAAAIIAHFKDGIGNIYLYPAGTRDVGEGYRYTVKAENPIGLIVESGYAENWTTIYTGPIDDFDPEKVEASC